MRAQEDDTARTNEDATRDGDTGASPPTLAAIKSGLLVGAVFVLGLVVGAVTVSLLSDDPVVVAGDPVAADGGESDRGLPPEDAAAEFVVSGACLGAVNAAQDTLLVLDDVGEAATELDAARLDEIVRGLMPVQTRLDAGLDACRVAVDLEPGTAPVSPGAPSTAPASPDAGD